MQNINLFDKVVFKIYDTCQGFKPIANIVFILADVLMLFYYLAFLPSMAIRLVNNDSIWTKLYSTINPFTTGAYILGVLIILHFIIYDSLVIKTLISAFYGMIVSTSIVAIMGMTRASELVIYIPHILIISLCIVISIRKWKKKAQT